MAALKRLWKRFSLFSYGSSESETVQTRNIRDEDVFTSMLGPLESYVVTIQSILIWEKPLRSSLTFLLFNVLFWVVISCKCRFYFVLAAVTAFVYGCRTWVNQIWPEIRVPIPEGEDTEEWTPVNPQVLSVPEISRYLNQMSETVREWGLWLIDLRKTEPGRFCALVTCILVAVTVTSHYISGVVFAYILMTAVMLGPGFFVHVYPQFMNRLHFRVLSMSSHTLSTDNIADLTSEPDELDEFLPEPNPETLEVLAGALNSPDTDETEDEHLIASQELGLDDLLSAESDNLSLQAGLHELPSYDKNSDDELDEFNFDPNREAQRVAVSTTIKFVSSHFNENSDESEEERLAIGLDFNESSVRNSEVASAIDDDVSSTRQLTTALSEQQRTEPVSPDSGCLPDRELVEIDDNLQHADQGAISSIVEGCINESGSGSPSFTRQHSTQSDADLSDYEIVSESELS